ncbi:iron-containing alcohol dehydrogenase [Haloferax sulfurifontis]|uniref:1,3-propanediol dehydrogenase n=3 Tax=Haloferax sulfurifontis TaxID=255616 RepID=M0HYD3_9EURY|nr:1,3-propanediol dehydrogenase [Haloferax sulfurifontis ATCC BAA-897]GGC66698.1 hypothetical protein GCM10007209_31010 [Haloferax sulfurifontis]
MCFAAATLAGQAFVNSGLGAVHALTYPLVVEHGIGRGLANAVLLPHVMEYDVPSEPDRFAEIATLLGQREGPPGDTTLDLAYESVDAVKQLNEDTGTLTLLSGFRSEPILWYLHMARTLYMFVHYRCTKIDSAQLELHNYACNSMFDTI